MIVERPPRQHALWETDEHALVRRLWHTHSAPEIADVLGRSTNAVRDQATKLGLPSKFTYERELDVAEREVLDHQYVKACLALGGFPSFMEEAGRRNQRFVRPVIFYSHTMGRR